MVKAVDADACPLEDLPVNEGTLWLDHVLQPDNSPPGNQGDLDSAACRTHLMKAPKDAGAGLRDATIIAVRSKDQGNYKNPIQKLLFLS